MRILSSLRNPRMMKAKVVGFVKIHLPDHNCVLFDCRDSKIPPIKEIVRKY
jgi:hypothetical protein